MMPRGQINDEAIREILDKSVDGDSPLSEKTIKELGEALGGNPDKIFEEHERLRQEIAESDESDSTEDPDEEGSPDKPFVIVHRERWVPPY